MCHRNTVQGTDSRCNRLMLVEKILFPLCKMPFTKQVIAHLLYTCCHDDCHDKWDLIIQLCHMHEYDTSTSLCTRLLYTNGTPAAMMTAAMMTVDGSSIQQFLCSQSATISHLLTEQRNIGEGTKWVLKVL